MIVDRINHLTFFLPLYFAYWRKHDIVLVSFPMLLAFAAIFTMESDLELTGMRDCKYLNNLCPNSLFAFSPLLFHILLYHISWFLYDLIFCWRYSTFEHQKVSIYKRGWGWWLRLNGVCMSCVYGLCCICPQETGFLYYRRSYFHYALSSH